jgi:hypothetical protein
VAGDAVVAHLVPERAQGLAYHGRGDRRLGKRDAEISAVRSVKPREQGACLAGATLA